MIPVSRLGTLILGLGVSVGTGNGENVFVGVGVGDGTVKVSVIGPIGPIVTSSAVLPPGSVAVVEVVGVPLPLVEAVVVDGAEGQVQLFPSALTKQNCLTAPEEY